MSHPDPTNMSDQFTQDFIHGLSQLDFHHGHGRDTVNYTQAPVEVKQHVELLDGLALLLVFEPKGDVAATSLWTGRDEITLLWAKNEQEIRPGPLLYVQHLHNYIMAERPAVDFLDLVIPAAEFWKAAKH